MDIRKSISALLEMAIADFFYCENLPDSAVESNHFCKILDGFSIPSRKKIGGELLLKLKLFQKCSEKKVHTQVNC